MVHHKASDLGQVMNKPVGHGGTHTAEHISKILPSALLGCPPHHAQVVRSGYTALILDIGVPGMLIHYDNAGDCYALVCDSRGEETESMQETTDLNAKSPSEQE